MDISQFYEHISIHEYAIAARELGLPMVIIALTAHQYLGPRHLRLQDAYSLPMFPRKSLIAGCTWATTFIRVLIIGPMDGLLNTIRKQYSSWGLRVSSTVYVDDAALSTSGERNGVILMHAWATRTLLRWVKNTLRKIAVHKLQIIAADRPGTDGLRNKFSDDGLAEYVFAAGDMLGVDYAAGGPLKSRKLLRNRTKKARKRKGRLRWLRNLGGDAGAVAIGGIEPSVMFGSEAYGITDATRRDCRRIRAGVCRVRAGASSTTAKLALGGRRYSEADPGVLRANPPLIALAACWWDEPTKRAAHPPTWRLAKKEVEENESGSVWRRIRGPVGAAMAHLRRIGASWTKPFVVNFLGTDVDPSQAPPLQLRRILRAHARRYYDRVMVSKLIDNNNWATGAVSERYSDGIDWSAIRELLQRASGNLAVAERHALVVLVSGGFWPEERRWQCGGYLPSGTCLWCFEELGTAAHRLSGECMGADSALGWMRLAGRRITRETVGQELAPLLERGLPPFVCDIRPREIDVEVGHVPIGTQGDGYGDASGVGFKNARPEVITWANIVIDGENGGDSFTVAGVCGGWFPSVPRGELLAYAKWLRLTRIPSTYYSDCQYVVAGARRGIPRRLTNSNSEHADLWRQVQHSLNDHGPGTAIEKVKAHRSHTRAMQEDGDERHWRGNDAADRAAKELAKGIWRTIEPRVKQQKADRSRWQDILARTAICAHLSQKQMDGLGTSRIKRRRRVKKENGRWICGDHKLSKREDGEGWWCSECHLIANTSSSRKSLFGRPCSGSVFSRIHSSHTLRQSMGVVWCTKCAAYTSRLPRTLMATCPGRPKSAAGRNVLRRLRTGLPPTTAVYHQKQGREWDDEVAMAYEAIRGGPRRSVREESPRNDAREGGDGPRRRAREESPRYDAHQGDDGPGRHAREENPRNDARGTGDGPRRRARDESPRSDAHQGNDWPRRRAHEENPRHEAVKDAGRFHASAKCTRHRGGHKSEQGDDGASHSGHLDVREERGRQDETPQRLPQPNNHGERGAAHRETPPRREPEEQTHSHGELCAPAESSPWTRRLTMASAFSRGHCAICTAVTSSSCRGCHRCICVACAKGRRSCPSNACLFFRRFFPLVIRRTRA